LLNNNAYKDKEKLYIADRVLCCRCCDQLCSSVESDISYRVIVGFYHSADDSQHNK